MALARLIVYESTSKWAVALRRQNLSEVELQIRETRTLDDCWQQAVASPASVVVLELTTANLDQLAVELPRYRAELRHAITIVVGARHLAPAECLMRELGAVHVVFSSREMGPLMRIVRRHCGRAALQTLPQDDKPCWRQRPWGDDDPQEFEAAGPEPDWLTGEPR